MSEMFSRVSGGGAQGLVTVLLVDGENIPQALAGQIITKTLPTGRPAIVHSIVQRVYGDVARLPAWEATTGFEMIHTGHAKNGADMRICIDALDLVHRGGVGRVVLASSDRDFTHLAQYLRARGIEVLGMGEAKTHDSFRRACSWFVELGAAAKPALVAKPQDAQLSLQTIEEQITALIKTEGRDGMLITALNVHMHKRHDFLIGHHEKKNWRGYLSAHPARYDLDAKGPSARVRLK